jgi:hypothetical protein
MHRTSGKVSWPELLYDLGHESHGYVLAVGMFTIADLHRSN